MISGFISSIAAILAQKASLKQTQKEEIKESLEEENIYRSESVFYVHAPKYMVPLIVFAILFFAGFAVFCYIADVLIGTYGFIAFDVFCFLLLLHEICFKIEVDSTEITVCRFLRKPLAVHASDITSCRIDNARNVRVYFGFQKIDIESTMVNAERFASFASSCAYKNASQLKRKYKVYNKGSDFTFIMAVVLFCVAVIFCPNLEIISLPDGKHTVIEYALLLFAFMSVWFIYKIFFFFREIKVDEKNLRFSYRKGFKLNTACFSQVETIQTKKRFLEEKAFNYKFFVRNKNGRLDKITFSTFEENSDAFFNAVYSTQFEEPEEDSE